jgi:low affinity Fe/Cu permease
VNRKGLFDRFADAVDAFTSRAMFFALCVLIVVVWAPSYFLFGSIDTWQLIINTLTTIVTFLLVSLQQNTNRRADAAIQKKLNVLAAGVADLLDEVDGADAQALRSAVGLEDRESSS